MRSTIKEVAQILAECRQEFWKSSQGSLQVQLEHPQLAAIEAFAEWWVREVEAAYGIVVCPMCEGDAAEAYDEFCEYQCKNGIL